jgi:hypothetical protein
MTADIRWFKVFAVSGLVVAWGCASAAGQNRYDVGVTDSEIKIGNLMPYSAPASLRCQSAFKFGSDSLLMQFEGCLAF